MYVVVRGKFEVFRNLGGGEARIAEVLPGEHFGEMALVTNQPRTASVRALEQSTVLRFGKESLFAQPKVAVCMLKSIVSRLTEELRDRNTEVILLEAARRERIRADMLARMKADEEKKKQKAEEQEQQSGDKAPGKVQVKNRGG